MSNTGDNNDGGDGDSDSVAGGGDDRGGGEIRLRRTAIVKVSGKWDEDGVEDGEVSRDGDEMVKMIVIRL